MGARRDNPVYSAAPIGSSFTELRVNAKNITENGEEMADGSVQLAVTYNIAYSDPFQSVPVDVDTEYHHIVVPEQNGVRYIPRNDTQELIFDLSKKPIQLLQYAIGALCRNKKGGMG